MKKELKYKIIRFYNDGYKRETGMRFKDRKQAQDYCGFRSPATLKGWVDGWERV